MYFPRHPVVKEESTSTKLRAVFNGSSPTTTGVSLNDQLLVGPKLQAGFTAILLRWRLYRFVLVTNIVEIFRQILIDPHDSDYYQRIIYRRQSSGPLRNYQRLTVICGTASASSLANRVFKQVLGVDRSKYPAAKGGFIERLPRR